MSSAGAALAYEPARSVAESLRQQELDVSAVAQFQQWPSFSSAACDGSTDAKEELGLPAVAQKT